MNQSKRSFITSVILGLLVLATTSPVRADPTSQPSTQPTVASVLDSMDTAYSKLQSAKFDGRIAGHFDAAGEQKNQDFPFTSSFAAPNEFRHEIPEQILLGSTGTTAYSYLTSREEYQTADAPKARANSSDWPASITRLLQNQNPSLLLAISKSAAAELNQLSPKITLQSPTVIDGTPCDTLRFDPAAGHRIITMLVDPATHLLRQVKYDLRKALEDAGTTDVKSAEITVDYTNSASNTYLPANSFAWTAPAGAMLAAATPDDDGMSDDLKALVGKDAPNFSLKNLDDKTVSLSDCKGNVTVLDFWAIWCAPCVQAMPHMDKLYKDQSANGLKVLAVNCQDEKDKVKAFVAKHGWSLPVLLDPDGTMESAYKAVNIPQIIVIGKDGKISQAFVGIGHEDEVTALVEAELKK